MIDYESTKLYIKLFKRLRFQVTSWITFAQGKKSPRVKMLSRCIMGNLGSSVFGVWSKTGTRKSKYLGLCYTIHSSLSELRGAGANTSWHWAAGRVPSSSQGSSACFLSMSISQIWLATNNSRSRRKMWQRHHQICENCTPMLVHVSRVRRHLFWLVRTCQSEQEEMISPRCQSQLGCCNFGEMAYKYLFRHRCRDALQTFWTHLALKNYINMHC